MVDGASNVQNLLTIIKMEIFNKHAKFSEKLTFLTRWYADVRVRISGYKMLVFRKILLMYEIDDPKSLGSNI